MKQTLESALQKLIAWVVVSSANPGEVSLAVKGALVLVIPTLMGVAGLAHLNLGDGSVLTTLVDGIAAVVQNALTLVGSVVLVVGTVRKIWFLVFPKAAGSTVQAQ